MGGRKEFHRWKETLESSSMSHWFQMSWHTCVYTHTHIYIHIHIHIQVYVCVCVCTLKIQKLKLKFNQKYAPIWLLFY